jgi:hypothetical protein
MPLQAGVQLVWVVLRQHTEEASSNAGGSGGVLVDDLEGDIEEVAGHLDAALAADPNDLEV